MTSRQDSIRALLDKASGQIDKIEVEYNNSLNTQTIDPALKIDIKNACENLRSVLDYLAADIRERHCPTAPASGRFYFPIFLDKRAFDSRLDQWFPGLRQSAPALTLALEAVQPFQVGHEWLGHFNRVNNENKHGDLVEQTRIETPQTIVTGQVEQVSWRPDAVTFESGAAVMGVPIDPMTQLSIPHPSIKVERIIWVDFQFAGIGMSALALLKQALAGIAKIEATVRSLLQGEREVLSDGDNAK